MITFAVVAVGLLLQVTAHVAGQVAGQKMQSIVSAQDEAGDSLWIANGISTSKARQKAAEYTGFVSGEATKSLQGPDTVVLDQDMTPFLHTQIAKRRIFRITFRDVVVEYELMDSTEWRKHSRDFDVYIDPMSGKLLKILSVDNRYDREYLLPDSVEEIEEKYRARGSEVIGFPDRMPPQFTGVLAKCPGSPYFAHVIEASYVLETSIHHPDPYPRWIILLKGIPPQPFFIPGSDKVPPEERSTMKVIYDVLTKKLTAVMPYK